MSLTLQLSDSTASVQDPILAWISGNVLAAAAKLGAQGDLRVRIVNDADMAAAHEEFAGVSGTTDVLTFDLTDPEAPRPQKPSKTDIKSGFVQHVFGLDTDILICLDEAQRQAADHGYPFERELLLYVVHGVLHCLGFDDHDERDFAEMHAMEDAVLGAIGVGPVFHRPREAGGPDPEA
jgi:probable rRNA maturation factor